MRKFFIHITAVVLILCFAVNIVSCGTAIVADDLMEGIKAKDVQGREADDTFIDAQMDFSLKLFKALSAEKENENVFISPLSVMLALAMTANGADGTTKAEMEAVLGGDIPLEVLNEYLKAYSDALVSGDALKIANSIWFREGRIEVKKGFLQTNADYYGAEARKAPFNDKTVEDINRWVSEHTNGMVDKVLEEIDESAVMFLINAMAFEAEWEKTYGTNEVYKGTFTSISGEKQSAQMMRSEESIYLSDVQATGFIKAYKGRYSFAALLPNEGVDIYEYIEGLTAAGLKNTLDGATSETVWATLPKFTCEYDEFIEDTIGSLGMPTAFNAAANFSKITDTQIYINKVLHKTYISVDELGTKAGAVTVVEMMDGGVFEYKKVTLDRPFVYMIIDNTTNLPVFMGVLTDIG